jgi:DNA repair exonuclease SbcCD ATPase subunit
MAKAKSDKPVETGSVLGKTLQEKQVQALERAKKALEGCVDGYTDVITKLNTELNDVYYKIQEKEELLKNVERTQTETRIEKITTLEDQITQLKKDYEVKKKDFDVSFELSIRSSKEKVLNELLQEFSLAYISEEKLEELRNNLVSAEHALDLGYNEAIEKTTKKLNRQHQSATTEQGLKHEKEVAQLTARNEQLESQVEFLEGQLTKAEARVNSILDNQVRVAQAGKGIVINTTDKK